MGKDEEIIIGPEEIKIPGEKPAKAARPKKNRYKHSMPGKDDSAMKKLSYFVTSVFGIGFIPFASGTFGSIAAIPLTWFLWFAAGFAAPRAIIVVTLTVFILGLIFTSIALRYSTPDKDPSFVVIDELAGQMATFIVPAAFFANSSIMYLEGIMYLAGFLLFRFFDIVKPFHVGWVERNVPGTLGVMLDDMMAALYATIVLCIFLAGYHFFLGTGPATVPTPAG